MSVTSGQTQGWSFSLKHNAPWTQYYGGSFSITGATTNGTGTATVQAGSPPDSNSTAVRTGGITQGVVIDNDEGITLGPITDFVTARACYRVTAPFSNGTYGTTLTFTHDIGTPPVRSVITQQGMSNVPCAKNFTLNVQVGGCFPQSYPACSLQGMWRMAETGVPADNPSAVEPSIFGPQQAPATPIPPFSCADANGDLQVDISDAIYVLQYLFLGGMQPCQVNNNRWLSQLLKTAQTGTYGLMVGTDGHYQAGQPVGLPRNDYIDNGNGTVTDRMTGLVWTKKPVDRNGDGLITDADLLGTGTSAPPEYPSAVTFINTNLNKFQGGNCVGFAGFCDWRLPTIRELRSICDYSRGEPAANPIFEFDITSAFNFWTSSPIIAVYQSSQPDYYYEVNFSVGHNWEDWQGQGYFARAVRNDHQAPHAPGPVMPPSAPFWCGDADGSGGALDITDAIYILSYLFATCGNPPCPLPCLVESPIAPMTTVLGRFHDNGDGTVNDSKTGLIWLKAPDTQFRPWCGRTPEGVDGAIEYAEGLEFPLQSGINDWRLPNLYELESLVDFTKTVPPLVDAVFQLPPPPPDPPSEYYAPYIFWTSTTDQDQQSRAFKLSFITGNIHNSSFPTNKGSCQDNNNTGQLGVAWAVRGGRGNP